MRLRSPSVSSVEFRARFTCYLTKGKLHFSYVSSPVPMFFIYIHGTWKRLSEILFTKKVKETEPREIRDCLNQSTSE